MNAPSVSDLPTPPPGRQGWPWTLAKDPVAARAGGVWPRITVVTPSYNQGRFLEETIRSVLLQGYPNLEYMIVDGGSTDDSVAIIRRYEPYLAWWASEPDGGPGEAINKAFARATGEIRAYLNSDDAYEPGALAAVAEAFTRGASWVAGRVRYVQEGLGTWPVPQMPGRRASDWFVTCPISQAGVFWSAALHRAAGPFREDLSYCFDYEFWMRLRFVQHVKPAELAHPVAVYRLHPRSKTMAENVRFTAERGPIRTEYLRRLWWPVRLQIEAVRRHRRACRRRAQAATLVRAGRSREGWREFGAALREWPVLAADWHTPFVIGQLIVGRGHASVAGPIVFPDSED